MYKRNPGSTILIYVVAAVEIFLAAACSPGTMSDQSGTTAASSSRPIGGGGPWAASSPPPPPSPPAAAKVAGAPDEVVENVPPAPAASADMPIAVYNVEFPENTVKKTSTQNGSQQIVLPPNQEAAVTFSLGLPRDNNALTAVGQKINDNLMGVLSNKDTNILVSMVCQVCNEKFIQRKIIHWNAAANKTGPATFNVTPVSNWRDVWPNGGSLVFWVDKDGNRFDTITVPIFVEGTGSGNFDMGQAEKTLVSAHMGRDAAAALHNEDRAVDLVLQPSVKNSTLYLALDPQTDRLKQVWPSDLSVDRSYQTGLTALRVTQIMRDSYVRLSATLAGVNRDVQSNLEKTPYAPYIMKSNIGSISNVEAQNLVEVLASAGSSLYSYLFNTIALREAWQVIEQVAAQYPADPIKIRIDMPDANGTLPWHWLHDGTKKNGQSDPWSFWGVKFELSNTPAVPGSDFPDSIGSEGVVGLFGGWSDESDADVTKLSEWEWMDLIEALTGQRPEHMFPALGEIHTEPVVYTSDSKEFDIILKRYAHKLNLIWVYAHASSGSSVGANSGVDSIGAHLEFGRKQWIDLDSLRQALEQSYRAFWPPLRMRPIVVLIGCETGTAGLGFSTHQTFPDVFLSKGAGAVVASDAYIEKYFGYYFGKAIMSDLANGIRLSRSVLDRRRWFLEKYNNPMGLLFSYYGSPGAKLAH